MLNWICLTIVENSWEHLLSNSIRVHWMNYLLLNYTLFLLIQILWTSFVSPKHKFTCVQILQKKVHVLFSSRHILSKKLEKKKSSVFVFFFHKTLMPKISPPSPPKFNEWLSGEAVVRHCLMIFKDKLSQEEIMSMSSIQEESRENGHLFYL